MTPGSGLLERESEIATLAALVDALATSGTCGSVLIKATLEPAHGGVREMLRPFVAMPAEEREQPLAGPSALPCAVLGLRDAAASELADPLYALSWLVANLAERSPVLIAVDDLPWLDAESGRAGRPAPVPAPVPGLGLR
jgi:hypothetical protein